MDGNVLGVDICQYFPPTESPYFSFPHHHSILASQGVVNRDVLGLGISQYFTHSMCRRPKNAKAFDGATIYINFTQRNDLQALKKPTNQSSEKKIENVGNVASTLLYSFFCWNDPETRWSTQRVNDRYKEHLVGQCLLEWCSMQCPWCLSDFDATTSHNTNLCTGVT